MTPKRKEEAKQLLERSEKLSDQIKNLCNELTLAAAAINREILKFDDARARLLFAKQTLLRLLGGI
jgi:hypothetical protein